MPIDFNRVQALCFDVDGTLRDTDDQYQEKIARLLKPLYRKEESSSIAARRIVMVLDTPINAIYTFLDWLHLDATVIKLLDRLHDLRLHKPKHKLPLIPGTLESLQRLDGKLPMSVVSARGEAGTLEFIAQHDLSGFFGCVASGQTTTHTKPWPDPVLWAAEQIGVPAENCLMIGDTTVDIRAGKAAGGQSVGVLSGFGDRKELLRAGADLIVEDVAELTGLLLDHIS